MNKPIKLLSIALGGLIILLFSATVNESTGQADAAGARQRINAPYFPGAIYEDQGSISWFGQVSPTTNSADIRVGYNDSELKVTVHVIDRRVWYDGGAQPADLSSQDALTLFLNTTGAAGGSPTGSSYRFEAQITWFENPESFAAAYRGNGSGWQTASFPYNVNGAWRGDLPNTEFDDKGWYLQYEIPFSSLGLSGPPAAGTIWGMGLAVHDRDDAAGTAIPDQTWPAGIGYTNPSTWGELHYGMPVYTPPAAAPEGTTTIYNGFNGQTVTDAHVGGHTTCGEGLNHWSEWGNKNYAGYDQINIQNQWDISDYPCFSRYFVTIPLDTVPAGKSIISADLIMNTFGNAGYEGLPVKSLIQVLTVNQDWQENTITWNNAPPPMQNIASTWVEPANEVGQGTLTYSWDVSLAVAEAYESGQPLRLALYSPDGNYHSGRYFWAAETGSAGPTLKVTWGNDSFDFNVSPRTRIVSGGGSAAYTINIDHGPNYNENVTLSAEVVGGGSVNVSLSPTVITPQGGPSTLTLTDQRAPGSQSAEFYAVDITATSGQIVQEERVYMLVNPFQVYLPMIRR